MANVLTRADVFSAYRYLLRSITIAFHGDRVMLSAARKEARNRFNAGKELDPTDPEGLARIDEAKAVGQFLRRNLVQGIKDGKTETYRIHLTCGLN